MSLLLTTSRKLPDPTDYDAWACVGETPLGVDPDRCESGLADTLEAAYDAGAPDWLALGADRAGEPGAELSHTLACAANVSDFGLMLAWQRLARNWAADSGRHLLICDDPWLFRHLVKEVAGIRVQSPPPSLWRREIALAIRGFLARAWTAMRFLRAVVVLRRQRSCFPQEASVLLVYGHPASNSAGIDGYFGDLMLGMPNLVRLLHVDAPVARARELEPDGRTFSLHAWGSPWAALALPFARWRPKARHGLLLRRAAALEGGTATGAAIRWQMACQAAWLRAKRPRTVTWPWENHAWERAFSRTARGLGVRTVGYQHATVGNREWNYGPSSNPDGAASLPDRLVANGPAGRAALLALGYRNVAVGGGFRLRDRGLLRHDPQGPVFVALPHDGVVAAEMVAAVRAVPGRMFFVKDHPMTPHAFKESSTIVRTNEPLERQGGLSAVLYAGTTVGLEALLGGLPCVRFQPRVRVPTDVMPAGVSVPVASAQSLERVLAHLGPPPLLSATEVVVPPDYGFWREIL